jgi:NADPH:quinone reductase-like Zn-dependent oxidoreductase
MKALIFEKYGRPQEVLKIREEARPVPKEHEVLVKIHCTAINDYDWSMVRGKPLLYRLMFGLTKPKSSIMGMELSGTVAQIGSSVIDLKIGDEVFGDISGYGFGTFAEYICIHHKALALKPKSMSFEAAAALPHASLLAYQGLVGSGAIQKGMKVLINGAGGGVGTIALQLAKLKGCEVTGVDSKDKQETLRTLGYDYLLDYELQDFTKAGLQYDLILDCKTNKLPFSYQRSLKDEGKYISIGGSILYLLFTLIWGKLLSLFSSKRLKILSLKPNEGLDYICECYEKQHIKCLINGPYPLESGAQMLQYFGDGKHKGKIVLTIY